MTRHFYSIASPLLRFFFFVGFLFVAIVPARADDFVVGVRAIRGIEEGRAQWGPTIDYLNQALPEHNFRLLLFDKLTALSQAAEHGALDYVITNPSSYVEMEFLYGSSRVLTLINKRQGHGLTEFGSVLFRRTDRDDIKKIEDVFGRTLMAVSEKAFGGWQMVWGELLKHGIDPYKDLSGLMFAGGNQEDVVYAVRDGGADLGVVRTDMLERMAAAGKINLDDYTAVGQKQRAAFPFLLSTDLYPEWAFAKFPHVSQEVSQRVVRTLLSLDSGHPAAQAGKYQGWTVPLNYQPVHELLKTLKVKPYETYGEITFRGVIETYWQWVLSIVVMFLFAVGAMSVAIVRGRQISTLRAEMLSEASRELEFQKFALDQHAIVSIADAKGDIVYANDKFCEISEYSREELIGNNHRMLNSGEHSKEFFQNFWRTISSGKVWHGEIKNLKKNGGYYWVRATIVPFLDSQGKPYRYVAIRTDITESKQAEAEIRAARDTAERANMAKSEFLSSMSHELRTPLNAIIGFAQLLEMDPLEEDQKDSVGQILRSGEHLLGLINDVLDLSRIESGNLSMSIEDVDPEPALQQCFNMTTSMAKKYGVAVSAEPFEGLPSVRADQTRLKQVLLNFLSNAVKYNNKGGTVTLSCQRNDGGFLRFLVVDTGPGIPLEKQKHLFVPFSRLEREGSEIEGTGIGLTITKELVSLMGGRIGFQSVEGEGSTFWFDLPVTGEGATLGVAQDSQIFSGKRSYDLGLADARRLLYVEDNPANLMLVEKIIRRVPNLTLSSATTAEAGLEMAEAEQPDAILMDINLPGMDGVDAMKIISQRESLRDIPVVAVSAAAMDSDINRGMAAGFRTYLTKPIKVDELLATLKTVFASKE